MMRENNVRPPMIPNPGCSICRSQLKVTGESIVKAHRAERMAHGEAPTTTFQPYRAIPQRHPSWFQKIIDRINWRRAFDLTCAILAALAIAYIFGFIFFGPK